MTQIYFIPLYFLLAGIGFFVFYYLFFAAVYFVRPETKFPSVRPKTRFLIVIPAHNEERLILETIARTLNVRYPKELFDIVVVADNCTDKTAEIVESGLVKVLRRHDQNNRGKGYAISWALGVLPLTQYHAIVVIDADTWMDKDFLAEMNAGLSAGKRVLQGYNHLRNPDDNSLTRLMHVTSVLKNLLFNEGRNKLGLSIALMGTGMCFDRRFLEESPWKAHSIGEDWEYSAELTRKGICVSFCASAITYAEEASSLRQGFGQRLRWSGGKFQTMIDYGFPTLLESIRSRDLRKLDTVVSILAPSFSQLAYVNVVATLYALLLSTGGRGHTAMVVALALLGSQVLYFVLGLVAMKASPKTALSVMIAPVFLCWKLVVDILALVGYRRNVWHRTERNVPGSENRDSLKG